ncbi:hypothetical protein GCM10022221_81800 [Actinocorallia aurea]
MTPAEIAYRDQYRAAEAEVRRVLNRSAAQTGTAVKGTEASWIRERFAEFGRTMVAGEGTFCPHITRSPMSGTRPRGPRTDSSVRRVPRNSSRPRGAAAAAIGAGSWRRRSTPGPPRMVPS